ncbi:KRI1-like family-domain-containing protein [Kickxella alabastrina]|uniref:KRI1-like family-domain-containing protein n=1 Tax=Kickxella alabastrina TaxID=61397 RepID=UPI002220682F|nr:KRI1-like family-domain-containing protein [Kickxella alabastrina]KAI7834115.1 KRI1-like family-domain-containing protein [Kickxella alabastrina]
MAEHTVDSDIDAGYIDLSKIDKKKIMRADERRRRANDELGDIEDYLSEEENNQGPFSDESSDESDVAEDEHGELITPEVDAQIMRALGALRSKDKSIYDSNVSFFSTDAIQKSQEAWKAKQDAARAKSEGMNIREFQHKVMVEHGGVVDEEAEVRRAVGGLTHVQEQEALKNEFKAAFGDNDEGEDEEGEDGGFLVKKVKSKEEVAKEEVDYRRFLLENMGTEVANTQAFSSWAAIAPSTKPAEDAAKPDPEQTFLMNYILNRGWIDKDAGGISAEQEAKEIVDKEEDEKIVELTDNFESKYNFRFEEQGGTQIKSYPREIEGSLRRKDDRRKLARERSKARKLDRKREKAEELKRLKNQKKKEILEKLKEIQGITGNKVVGFDSLDLDGDFDPVKFDSQMSKIFDDEYYNQVDDLEKPTWDDDIDIGDIVPDFDDQQFKGKRGKKDKKAVNTNGDDDFMMDADYMEGANEGRPSGSVDSHALDSTKAALKDTVSDYLDNYYQLDFEDIVGDGLATRFKYAKVKPVDYGLSASEILLADDKFLNEYVSVKRIATHRPDWKIDEDMQKYANKKRMLYVKKKAAAKRDEWEGQMKKAAQVSIGGKKKRERGEEKAEKASKKSKTEKAAKSDKVEKVENVEKSDKKSKAEKTKKSEKKDKADKDKADKKGKEKAAKEDDGSKTNSLNRRQRQKAKKMGDSSAAATAVSA